MRIEGFTYVRNGFKMGYPFLPSINSVLPIVDQLFVVVGDSEDGTREAIENIKNDKIVIVDSIWEEEKRVNGEIFKDQANLGLQKVAGDWAIHIQADEVLNEADGEKLINYIHKADDLEEVCTSPFLYGNCLAISTNSISFSGQYFWIYLKQLRPPTLNSEPRYGRFLVSL